MKNWSGNVEFVPERLAHPKSVSEIAEIVSVSTKVRAVGSAHSFNRIADSHDTLIAFDEFPHDISIDSVSRTVRVSAGVRYGELAIALHAAGFALPNMGSLPHITVVGATSTGTHGSGVANQNLSAAISRIELINADGEDVTIAGVDLSAARVGLGALGIIHHVTLNIIPAFELTQAVYVDLPFQDFLANFHDVMAGAYSVSAFTTWGDSVIDQLWVKALPSAENVVPDTYFGAKIATTKMHPLAGADTQSATEQMGSRGPWHERLPHFKLDFTPSFGEELQSEFFIDITDAKPALEYLYGMRELIQPYLLVSELRTIARDENWLSPSYQRDSLAIHFTWKPDVVGVRALLPTIEAGLNPYNARPHWGKLFTDAHFDFQALYPQFSAWKVFRDKYDTTRKFTNAQLEAWGI